MGCIVTTSWLHAWLTVWLVTGHTANFRMIDAILMAGTLNDLKGAEDYMRESEWGFLSVQVDMIRLSAMILIMD